MQGRPGVRPDLPVDQQMVILLEAAHGEIGAMVKQPVCSDVQQMLHLGHARPPDPEPEDAAGAAARVVRRRAVAGRPV